MLMKTLMVYTIWMLRAYRVSSLPAMGEYTGVMMSFYVGEADVDEFDEGDWMD